MCSFWTFGPQGSRQDTSICFEKTRFDFRSFEHVRKDTQTDLHIPADLSHTACSLIDFIFWLDNIKSEKARRLIQQIIYWLSIIFDFGAWWDFIDEDILNIPIVKGPQRVRTSSMPLRFKEHVSRTAAAGQGFTSGAHVMSMCKKLKMNFAIKSFKSGNDWADPMMARYYAECQSVMQGFMDKVYSLSWDGTRLSGKDYLFGTLYACGKACWAPPIAPIL